MAWQLQRPWERMADHKGVYDASHLNAVCCKCLYRYEDARPFMSATMPALRGISQAGYIPVQSVQQMPDPSYRARTSLLNA